MKTIRSINTKKLRDDFSIFESSAKDDDIKYFSKEYFSINKEIFCIHDVADSDKQRNLSALKIIDSIKMKQHKESIRTIFFKIPGTSRAAPFKGNLEANQKSF